VSGAHAQIDNGLPGSQPFDIGGFVMKDTLLRLSLEEAPGKSKPRAKSAAVKAATVYRASPTVSAMVRQQYLDGVAKQSPRAAEALKAAFAKQDPIQQWSQLVRSDGLHTGDVADAFTGYWLLNWAIANRSDGTRTKVQAVREQVRPVIASNLANAGLTEAQRQEMAEMLMLNFVAQHGVYNTAMSRNDTALLTKLGDAAVTRFKNETGMDLRQLELTERGFRKKE
jgi:hypothetical protein